MVHHQLHTLRMGVLVKSLYIKVRIGSYEVKHILFPVPEPVFPTDIPAFYQHLIQSVRCSKVYVSLHVGCVCRVMTIWFGMSIVCLTELNRVEIIGVSP